MWQAYWNTVLSSHLDWFILGFAGVLIFLHLFGVAMRVSGKKVRFVQDIDRYRELLLFLTEILPMLGLLGTVLSLLHTFKAFALGAAGTADFSSIIETFAPALSTTVSGLLGSVINLVLNAALLASPLPKKRTSHEGQ